MKDILLAEDLKKKHQIFTPKKIVNKMLKIADDSCNKKLYNCKILENSCGNGNILIMVVERFIKEAYQNNLSSSKIKCLLQKNIQAYELDELLIKECVERLNNICKTYDIYNVKWNIKNKDFLTEENSYLYDIVIGNPPYISYLDLPFKKRKDLKNKLKSCAKGKFDYSYAFIEKSYYSLNSNGSLIYLVPSNWFKNVFARNLRLILLDDLVKIIDFQKQRIFKNALVSTAIIHVVKDSKTDHFKYNCPSKKIYKLVEKSTIIDKWIFTKEKVKNKLFSDNFDVFISIATLCNKVFVLPNGYVKGDYYYFNNYKIELDVLRPTCSPKDKKYNCKEKKIIFPYFFENEKLLHYTQSELKKKFPYAYKYLEDNKSKLLNRCSEKNAKWYEYGRSQAIVHMNKEKCIISSIISDKTEAYIVKKDEIPYSGICIVPKNNSTLSDVLRIINSKEFRKYVQTIGVCVNGNSKRISPNDIKNYTY